MVLKLNTYQRSLSLKLNLQTNNPRKIVIVGFDPAKPNTEYFFRQMWVDGKQSFTFGMPQSPKTLHILIFDKEEGIVQHPQTFRATYKAIPLLPIPLFLDSHTRDFVRFAQDFAEKAGVKPPDDYTDPKRKFLIEYKPIITSSETGAVIPTPARIHKGNDRIQASKEHFDKMTVPMRMIILLHEYSHNFLNDDITSETESDMNGLRIYLSLGYPHIEAVYAFTTIFTDSEANIRRLAYIDHFLTKHNIAA